MNLRNPRRYWIAVLWVIILESCTTKNPSTVPPLATSQVTLEITATATAQNSAGVTPSPVSTASPTVTKDCTRGDYVEEITSGGQVRQYRLHIPSTYDPETPAALVLGFHGASSSAQSFERYSRFSALSNQEGFIAAYPQGLSGAWNTMPGSNNPDTRFIRDLIDHLKMRCNIDSTRIYLSGASNGGGMAERLACELADRIAAIGTVSGAYQGSGNCSPAHPVAVFAIHGTDDPVIPYEGIPEWAASWAERNSCDPTSSDIVHNVVISEKKWSNCRAGTDVILYTIQGGKHEWPTHLINAAELFWNFFAEHPNVDVP